MRRGSSDDCRRLAVALTVWLAAVGLSAASHAQGLPPPAPTDAPVVVAPAEPPPPAPPPQAVVAVVPQQADTPRVGSESDFNVEQRRWALGYAGVSIVPTGAGSITVPAVGLRYWVSPSTGLDVALGIGWTGGSTETAGMSTDKNAVFGILVQGGVPFVLAAHRHVNFEVIPYLTLGYGRTSTGMNYWVHDRDRLQRAPPRRRGARRLRGVLRVHRHSRAGALGHDWRSVRIPAECPEHGRRRRERYDSLDLDDGAKQPVGHLHGQRRRAILLLGSDGMRPFTTAGLALCGAMLAFGCSSGTGPATPPFDPFGTDPSGSSSEPSGASNEAPAAARGADNQRPLLPRLRALRGDVPGHHDDELRRQLQHGRGDLPQLRDGAAGVSRLRRKRGHHLQLHWLRVDPGLRERRHRLRELPAEQRTPTGGIVVALKAAAPRAPARPTRATRRRAYRWRRRAARGRLVRRSLATV